MPTGFLESVKAQHAVAKTIESSNDDFSRNVYCVLGIPIDAIEMHDLVDAIRRAAADKVPFLISTPNLNYLINNRSDPEFRESLLSSDLCPPDGMPIVWIARLLGLPIKHRVAGSDLFEVLTHDRNSAQPLKVFFFGGAEGAAEAAGAALNAHSSGLRCVGSICPGFGTINEMSDANIFSEINASAADLLLVALGARKGQLWLLQNHDQLRIPVRAHLGATINFAAGTVSRAPSALRKLGLEWLWRIKEEPHLWRRYWHDGMMLLRLLFSRVLPLAIMVRWNELTGRAHQDLRVECTQSKDGVTLTLAGAATHWNAEKAAAAFRDAVSTARNIRVNLSQICVVDARFLGLLLMLEKRVKRWGCHVSIIGASPRVKATFRLNGADALLAKNRSA
jgi:N-acetylglucosaminyldiphosphoundecaprenol N-acetyl-beta-D-mannosaminyltransferase